MKIKYVLLFWVLHESALADVSTIQANLSNESYNKSVEVSGKYLVGVQLKTATESKALHVILPDKTTGNLCVNLSSIDGKYKAKIEYPIIEPRSGLTRVSFDTEYKDIFKKYKNDELAISASLAKPCDDYRDRKMLVSSWSEDVSDDLILLIRSSARKDVAHIGNNDDMTKCKKFRNRDISSVSYDKYCVLKGVANSGFTKIEIVRKNLQSIEPKIIEFY